MHLFKCVLLLILFAVEVEAKYVYPEGATTTTERKVNRRIRNYDTNHDGELSFEEYQNFRKVRTRDDRRMDRRAKKKGTYLSPEDVFKKMDADEDGVVTKEEMMEYEKK